MCDRESGGVMGKYTKGPWGVRASGEVGTKRTLVAIIYPANTRMNKANAQLISAAPEMYEAIKSVISFIDGLLRYGGVDRDNQEALISYHKELKQAIKGVDGE